MSGLTEQIQINGYPPDTSFESLMQLMNNYPSPKHRFEFYGDKYFSRELAIRHYGWKRIPRKLKKKFYS